MNRIIFFLFILDIFKENDCLKVISCSDNYGQISTKLAGHGNQNHKKIHYSFL